MRTRLKKLLSALLAALLLAGGLPAAALAVDGAADETETWADRIPAMLAAGPYAEGEVLVAVDAPSAGAFDLLAALGLRESLSGEAIMTVPVDTARSGEAVLTFLRDPTRTTEELLYALAGDQRVAFAEPNYRAEVPAPADDAALQNALLSAAGAAEPVMDYADVPDLTALQWENARIHTPGHGPTGSNMDETVVVAVIDGAVDFTSPDLAPVAYTFTDEQLAALAAQGISCGEHGYSVFTEDGVPFVEAWDDNAEHGTHVAGTIGAAWDGHGVSGVASNVKIISVQALARYEDGNNYISETYESLKAFRFLYLANKYAGANVRVTNNSYGAPIVSMAVSAACRALGEEFGTVSFFAGVNDAQDHRFGGMDAIAFRDNPYVIVVGATDMTDAKAWYSNYNDRIVDLAAPGSQLLSAAPLWKSSYLAEAENVWYEGFEDAAPRLGVALEGAAPDAYVITDDTAAVVPLSGAHALKLPLDSASGEENEGEVKYWLDLTLSGVPKDEPFRYLGLSFFGNGMSVIRSCWDFAAEAETECNDRGRCLGNAWGVTWMDLSAGEVYRVDPDTDTMHVRLSLLAPADMDALWIDAVGLGNALVPYQYESGTSMACPVVAGAAAVLAAQGYSGTALADLVCSKVRQSDALNGLVRTAGIFDFDASGAVPPRPSDRADKPVYDTVHPLPDDFGDPFVSEGNAFGDVFRGVMTGLGDALYYLADYEIDYHVFPDYSAYRYLYAFNLRTQQWSVVTELPEYLSYGTVSMAAWEGKLVIFGLALGPFEEYGERGYKVLIYDPAADTWTEGSTEGELYGYWMLMVNLDGQLWLLGGGETYGAEEVQVNALQPYDPETGYGEPAVTLQGEYLCWRTQAAVHDGAIWLYNQDSGTLERVTPQGSELLGPDGGIKMPDTDTKDGLMGAYSGGLVLFALPSRDNETDTWLLRDGTDEFVPMLRKTTRDAIFSPAGTVYRDRVYVKGFAAEEETVYFFRSNAVATLDDPNGCDPGYDYDYGYDPAPAPAAKADETKKTEPAAVTYTDVPADAWYAGAVAYVTEKGLFEGFGDGTFRPEAEMDRAMAVQVLWNLAGRPAADPALPFGDVAEGDWYAAAVRWACAAGITNGTGEGFEPDAPVTREQFAAMLYRFVQLSGKGFTGMWSFRLDFPDAGNVSDWALEGVSWLVMNGILKGMDGELNPQGVLTRAQTAALLQRVAEALEA